MSGHRFSARGNMIARFGEIEFGVVHDLDIGEYYDPTQLGLQFYVFPVDRRQDVVRYQSVVDAGEVVGRLGRLLLRSQDGASYRVEAVCAAKQELPQGGFEYVFEAQLPSEATAPAQQRHGVESLAAGLLLDALTAPEPDDPDDHD